MIIHWLLVVESYEKDQEIGDANFNKWIVGQNNQETADIFADQVKDIFQLHNMQRDEGFPEMIAKSFDVIQFDNLYK